MTFFGKEPNVQRIDMTGKRCGTLTAIEYAGYNKERGEALWKCRCDCGKEIVTSGRNLRRGKVRSCGCSRFTTHLNKDSAHA